MKKIKVFALILATLLIDYGCSKSGINQAPTLIKKTYSGCFNDIGLDKNLLIFSSDTMYYEIINDLFNLHVIINRNCTASPVDSVVINQNTVKMYVKETQPPMAYCSCEYIIDYSFKDFSTLKCIYLYYRNYNDSTYSMIHSLPIL